MNERIRKLARQADVHILPDESEYGHTIIGLEKFAELIVRECAKVFWNIDDGELHEEYVRELKKHFEVK